MGMLTVIALTCYLMVMPVLFLTWLGFFLRDAEMTLSERRMSKLVLGIATLFWPVVLPLAYVELLGKVKRYERRVKMAGLASTILSDPTY